MSEEEYIALRKKELSMKTIRIDKKDEVRGFNLLLNLPFALSARNDNEYWVSELALPELDKAEIKYEVLK